jgi:Ser/Thr protein kinase RdoA (MazF antagonist)
MAPYETLSARGRVARVRKLARTLVGEFGLDPTAPLPLLADHENITFSYRGKKNERLAVRVHRAGNHTALALKCDAAWLAALGQALPDRVPGQLRTHRGEAVVWGDLADLLDAPRAMSISTWLPGTRAKSRDLRWAHAVGDLTALLHRHSARWTRPSPWERPRWDGPALCLGLTPGWGPPESLPGLPPDVVARLEPLRFEVSRALAATPMTADTAGLIHADLHLHNVHLLRERGGHVRALALDFDDCGDGYWWYDAAVSLSPTTAVAVDTAMIRAWAEGYVRHRPLPPGGAELLPVLWMARRLIVSGWVAGKRNEPSLAEHLPVAARELAWLVPQYDRGELHALAERALA